MGHGPSPFNPTVVGVRDLRSDGTCNPGCLILQEVKWATQGDTEIMDEDFNTFREMREGRVFLGQRYKFHYG